MSSHAGCTHEATKAARAACRAHKGATQGDTPATTRKARTEPPTPAQARALASRTRKATQSFRGDACECGRSAAFVQDDAAVCVLHIDQSRSYKIIPL